MPISPSRSPSPHPFTRHPNIFITSPTSPSIYPSPHPRSPSRESQTHSNLNAQAILPTLASPNSGPSQNSHSFQTPSSSPTASDFVPTFFNHNHRLGHARSQSHLGARITRQPNITLTFDTSDDGRVEKRARTESDRARDGPEGLRTGEEMDVVPSDAGEDAKLPSPMSLTSGTSTTMNAGVGVGTGGGGKVGLRSRSDSAPMWGGEGCSVQGGLSANWMGRGRSGSSFGQ